MPINDEYFTGSTVSRHLPPGERSFDSITYQSGKAVLDSELILSQEATREIRKLLWDRTIPSGWLRGPTPHNPRGDYNFPESGDGDFVADAFQMVKRTAIVAGYPIVVEYTNTGDKGLNVIQLDSAPVFGGAAPDVKRTDFVFLEVWKALVSDSPNASSTVTVVVALPSPGDTITIAGTPLTAVAGAPGVDEFTISDQATTAANIAAAINGSPPNSFTTVTAVSDGVDTVTLTAVASGTAGNGITVAVSGVGMTTTGVTVGGVDTANKPTQDTIYRHGNVDADSSVNLDDDIADPIIGTETTKRVQIQYRLRVTGQSEAVNFKTEADGFSNASILAQGAEAAPVATYPFIKANNSTVSGTSDATAYGQVDNGLWIAGDGSSTAAAALGTLDGFVYAIPLCFVFRRNDASGGDGFAPVDNTQGSLSESHGGFVSPVLGVIPAGDSDRPDGAYFDEIRALDVLDLRRHVIPGGLDWSAELRRQMQLVLDGNLGTWAVDTADKQDMGGGSGNVSPQFLICNEVGRSASEGGIAPTSGDTTRGVSIANFDHVRRRFGDQPVVEQLLVTILVTDIAAAQPGKFVTRAGYAGAYAGWAEDDEINIDLSSLNASSIGDFDDAGKTYSGGSGGSVFGFAPPGTTITNVRGWHDDGHFTTAVPQDVQFKTVNGLGSGHLELVLDVNDRVVNGGDSGNPDGRLVGDSGFDTGSARRIFLEVEVTYPLGSGTTDTPDAEVTPDATVYTVGPLIENDTSQRPVDGESLLAPNFREGKREVGLEYVANDGSGFGSGTPISDTLVSRDTNTLYFPRRVFGSGATLTGVTDLVAAQPHDVNNASTEYGSASRKVVLDISGGGPEKDPLSGLGQTLCSIAFFAQDAIPNYGAGGYQVAVYYRSNAPQTAGVKSGGLSLPASLTVAPLVMAQGLWTGTAGVGSADVPFPYTVPMDQIPVNGDVGVSEFPGEWYFASTVSISVDDFSADTGLLNLHTMLPMDGTENLDLSSPDTDIEFRSHYKVADPSAYRPTIFAQPLSGVSRHKVWFPFLAVATADSTLWRKNEVLLIVVTRFAELDDQNNVAFANVDNATCAAVYRTRGLLMLAGE